VKILVVAPFPPLRDGVGKYAAQEVRALRDEGHDVEVLAPIACAAHYVENFKTVGGGLAKLRGYARRYDRVILQYQPAHFHWRSEGIVRMISNFWMMVAFRTIANLEIVCHEAEYGAPNWPNWRPEKLFDRLAWSGARHVEFHTEHEIAEMQQRLGVVPRGSQIRDHGRYFRPAVVEDRTQARRRLALPEGVPLLLCIGFIQPHKGFDRAVRAFRRVPGRARLAIVGSVRTEIPAHRGYMDELHYLAAGDDRVDVHERMVSDDEFDRWIVASDAVVLPYREIWSSGVIERAHLLNRPVIGSGVGGMAEQLRGDDVLVTTDDELSQAMAKIVGAGEPVGPVSMTLAEALAFVEEETRRRGGAPVVGGTPMERALHDLRASRGVHAITLPSRRRFIGRLLNLAKRVMRRSLGWFITPLLGQINYFQELTAEALEQIAAAQRELARSVGRSTPTRPLPDDLRARLHGVFADLAGPVIHVGGVRGDVIEDVYRAGIEVRETAPGAGEIAPAAQAGAIVASRTGEGADEPLDELVATARTALRPGGLLVIESNAPNGPGDAVDVTAEQAGFEIVEIYRSPVTTAREPIEIGADAPEWAQRLAKSLDEELDALHNHVAGAPRRIVVARAPIGSDG
jgi:glycosyltransferase involved in cell wall biosynthesis